MMVTCIIQKWPEDRVLVHACEESHITELKEDGIELPEEVLIHTGNLDEDISRIRELGLQVDHDN